MLIQNDKKHYEKYHLYPTHGLLNDPNGLIYFKEQYHVFFQWNPHDCNHKYKEWGHFVSDDLKTWSRVETALKPSISGMDSAGIYSGTAFVKDDKLYVFYTGNVRNDAGQSIESHQMWAVSEDGIHFTKLGELFPHPEGFTKDVRDPKVWQGKNGHYFLMVGARSTDDVGDILLYESVDFNDWQLHGSLIEGELTEFRGYMIECPDLIEIDGKYVLMFSPQGLPADSVNHRYENIHNTGYVVGVFDEETMHFIPETEFKEVDNGFEFYAPQTMHAKDGRKIMWGWAGMMTPEREIMTPTIANNQWVHVLSLPRELHVTKENILTQKPINEILDPKPLKDFNEVSVGQYTIDSQADWQISIGNDVILTRTGNQLVLSRRQWESGDIETREIEGDIDNTLLIVDTDIVEIYTNHNQSVMTARYF
ncbi:sucrose-6-phosphate hydrolase [Leuconostoc litchii]|uniref:Sucrose-6-phosphate hydrolase n=1 Tax=Leuconostoc litchii TaxID=1981069 RepID=A0A6P2CQE6_9LACO|nr:glycoside hydrolase family 32 protein [Leuconostoc litchii]TYC47613.1 sucrose-6-phosphate hydrolase [Leuconostoc litchii]GMA69660.1 sucrose-6-phosphate hydrolase [Leuconostoc litchii]